MKNRINILLVVLVLILTACTASEVVPARPSPEEDIPQSKPSSPEKGVQLGQSFSLMEGESVILTESQMGIAFVEVLEDSRCPTGMECFWEGNAKVLVFVGEEEYTLTIGKLLEGDQNAVELEDGSTLRLLLLDPYPDGSGGESNYRVTLIVEGESSQPFNYPKNI